MQQKTHPSLINYVGGAEAYQQLLQYAQNLLAKSQVEIVNVQSKPPLYSYIVDHEEICFVPKTITMKVVVKFKQHRPHLWSPFVHYNHINGPIWTVQD
jgi:hypothetical protein